VSKLRFRLKQTAIIAASIHLIFGDVPGWAGPVGPQVVNGAATFAQPNASTLNVTNSPGAIVNWRGFSIGAGELTRFIQQSSSSSVLNRVVGPDISQIYGQLLSNGRVFLINPSGIIIGPGAVVDTAGFVASTLNMLDGDFLAGKLKFQGDASSGSIVNQGWIRTGYGGKVILVAPQIENSGLIHTPGGELILAAGQKLTVSSLDLEGVQFEIQAPTDSVVNLGKLLADGGAVGVFAGTLRHTGEIRANALVYDEGGRVVLKAQNDIQIAGGSTTSADGKIGGGITIQSSQGLTRVAGDVSAQGSAGQGGDIRILGNSVSVVENAVVNASGSAGGGQILVGGDYQGNNPSIQNSNNTFVGSAAMLRADATQAGDGGRIIVWSDDKTQFYGSLSAQGGPLGGNGGFAEVSGKQNLIFAGGANLGATRGGLGTLLLDPLDLFAFAGGGLNPTIIDEATDFPSNAATVSPATLAAITGNVTLFASRYMRISDPIALTTAGQGLTAQVGTYTAPALPDPLNLSSSNNQINNIPNRLDIGGNVTTAGGAVSLIAPAIQSFNAPTITTAGAPINVTTTTGAIQAFSLSLDAGAGAVTATSANSLQVGAVTGGSFSATASGSINTGAITDGAGAVSLSSSGSSVFASSITTAGGSVTGNAAFNVSTGAIATGGGNVSLTGTSSSVNTGAITAGSGNVTLSGTSVSAGAINNTGTVGLTATAGSIFASSVDAASSLTATATNTTSTASVFINGSSTVLNATNVSATATSCFSAFSCPAASVTLNATGNVNIGTVTASAPATTANTANFGAAYADPRFENINESVNIFSSAGAIKAMGGTSSITATNVSLATGLLSGGGIGQLATPLPLNVDVKRAFTFQPNGEFNVLLTGTGPNNLNMQVGVAPTGQSYSGSLSKTGLALNVSANDTSVTASTFDITSGFDQRVFNGSPGITFYVPNGNLSAPSVKVPAGDVTGTASPTARHNCDIGLLGACPPALTIEPLSVLLRANNDLSISSYTRAAGTLGKSTTFRSDSGSVTLGTVDANRDSVIVQASTFQPSTNVGITGALTTTGAVNISALEGDVTINSLNTSGGPGAVTINALGTVGALSTSDSSAVEIQAGTSSVTINAGTIGNSANSFPLDIIAGTVSLTSSMGGIGFAGKPVEAIAQNLTVNAASTFNVSTSTVNLRNLTLTASPIGVGNGGLARVTSNGTNYDFASDGANFTLGGANFPAAVPAAQFAGGTLAFTATTGNLTLNSLDFSASNGNFSAATNGNVANITQTAGQAINLGTGTLTLKADGNVTVEGVNAGAMTATNATFNFGSGCSTVGSSFNVCGVTGFNANQTLTDTGNAGGTWSVTSRGAINTGALQVGRINFTAASGNATTGAIGTAAKPVSSVSISTTSTSAGGNIQTGAVEADSLTLSARGNVTVGGGSLPTDQANPIINAVNTDAATINLSSQTSGVTVNGALNAAAVTLTSPTAINTGNINPAALAPTSISLVATSGGTAINTGSLDGKTIQTLSGCLFCAPGDININGAIGAGPTKPTLVSIFANNSNSVVIAGNVTLDPAVLGSVFLGAGTTLTAAAGGSLGAVTAGDGSSITLNAGNAAIATPFQFTQVDAGATGSVTVNAPAGIIQTLATSSGGGITGATVNLSATSGGSTITGPAGPLTLRETSNLTLNAGGSLNVDRTGASGAPLLTNLDVTRSDNTAAVSLTGFAAGQAVTIANDTLGGGASVDVVNTSTTPLKFSYRNTDATNGNLTVTGTGIATKGGSVILSTTQNLTTGAIDTKSGSGTVPDGSIDLRAGQTLSLSGTVNAGASTIFGQGASITRTPSGQVMSTNRVTLDAFNGNIGVNTAGGEVPVTSPITSLTAGGASPTGGDVFAALTGTADLTINANNGFTVSSTVPLAALDITTQGSGIGAVSLTTTGAQSFGFARSGATLRVNGVTSTTPLTSLSLSVPNGNLTIKGGMAADALTLAASGTLPANGTLTLDGSSSALTLSNASQSFSGNAVTIQGNVTASATASQSSFAFNNLGVTGTGALSSVGSQNINAFGNVNFTTLGGPISISAANQNINAFGNLDFTAQGGAVNVTGANQVVSVSGGSSIMTLQGGAAAGQSVTFTGTSAQTIQTPDNTTSVINVLAGSGTDAAAKIIYSGTGTQTVQGGQIVLTGGSATGASALISTATGAQLVRANTDIKLTGGTASGADARIENTSTNQQRVGESEFTPFCCTNPYQTDNVILQGGTGAEAAIVASGLQKIQANNGVKVLGGSGAAGGARIENTSAAAEQRIGCNSSSPTFEFCSSTLDTLDVIAGTSGATAQILAAGTQRLRGTSNLTMTGNASDSGLAKIATTGSTQSVVFFGTDAILAGAGIGSDATIVSAGTQDLQFGTLSLTGGGTAGGNTAVARISSIGNQNLSFSSLSLTAGAGGGSFAKIDSGGSQQLSGGNVTLTAKGTDVAPISSVSAIIEGQNQNISTFGVMTLTGGSGTSGNTSDAVIRNTAGTQFVGASSILMNGGHTFTTAGILNQGSGTQTVNASGGITMQSDPLPPTGTGPAHADAFVLIQNTPATDQFINAGLSLTNSGLGTVAVTTPAKQTIIANNGGISISTLSPDVNSVTTVSAGGDQLIRARFVDVQTGAGSTGNASLAATGNQWIHTTSGTSSSSGNSMRVAALGYGTASVTAGASQLLELDYLEQMQGGAGGNLTVGDVNAVGTSLVQAVDQSLFARSIVIQGGSGTGSLSKLSASNTQTITTLLGGISVNGGSGDNSLATIDPLIQTILVNGPVSLFGGSGVNADASIVSAGTQSILTTNGDVTLEGGTGADADAFISSAGAQAILASGSISLFGGDGVGADAFIISSGLPQTISATGSISLTSGLGGTAFIQNPGGPLATAPFLCTSGCSFGTAAAVISTSPDATSSVLADQENQASVLIELAPPPEESTEERILICR
jgi:filamentous hemagglutinin family protein